MGDDWIIQDRSHGAPVIHGEVDHSLHQDPTGSQSGWLSLGGADNEVQAYKLGFGGGQHDLVLGVVLVIDGSFGYTDAVGDHLQGCPSYAIASKKLQGCADDSDLRGAGHGLGMPV